MLIKEIDQDAPTSDSIAKYLKDASEIILGFNPSFVNTQLLKTGVELIPLI